MAWNEYLLKCYAYSRIKKAESLESWEQSRFIAFHSRMAYQYKAPTAMSDILPLESDKFSVKNVDPEMMQQARDERAKALEFNENYLKNKEKQ